MRVMRSSILVPIFVLLVESVSAQSARPHVPAAASRLVRVRSENRAGCAVAPDTAPA